MMNPHCKTIWVLQIQNQSCKLINVTPKFSTQMKALEDENKTLKSDMKKFKEVFKDQLDDAESQREIFGQKMEGFMSSKFAEISDATTLAAERVKYNDFQICQ